MGERGDTERERERERERGCHDFLLKEKKFGRKRIVVLSTSFSSSPLLPPDRCKLVEQVGTRLKYFAGTSSLQKLHGERGAANSFISSSHLFFSLAHGKTLKI